MSVMVSVHMITYKHEKYISRAIEGVLMQQTTFPIQLVISDDCSPDGTAAIIKQYAGKHPDIIKPIYRSPNLGSMKNYFETFKDCTGKYIAFCDGDDYWTDPLKLQKQIDFLEANPDYSICAHHVDFLKGKKIEKIPNPADQLGETCTIQQLAEINFIVASSALHRNIFPQQLPDWFLHAPIGDYIVHILNAKNGKIKFMRETMAVYREHAGGIWSLLGKARQYEKLIQANILLLREEFDTETSNILRLRTRQLAGEYLAALLATNPDQFKTKLAELIAFDPEIGQEWLFNGHIEYINSIHQSKPYKLAQKFSGLASKWRKLKA